MHKIIDMQTQFICGFLSYLVGSYENHYFGINAHTFIIGWISYQRTKKCVLFPSLKVQGHTVLVYEFRCHLMSS